MRKVRVRNLHISPPISTYTAFKNNLKKLRAGNPFAINLCVPVPMVCFDDTTTTLQLTNKETEGHTIYFSAYHILFILATLRAVLIEPSFCWKKKRFFFLGTISKQMLRKQMENKNLKFEI